MAGGKTLVDTGTESVRAGGKFTRGMTAGAGGLSSPCTGSLCTAAEGVTFSAADVEVFRITGNGASVHTSHTAPLISMIQNTVQRHAMRVSS